MPRSDKKYIIINSKNEIQTASESNLWADFIETLDQEKWDHLLENMPTEIELAEPENLGNKIVELKQLEIL